MTKGATILIGIAVLLMLVYMLALPFLLAHYFSASSITPSQTIAIFSSIITFILGLFGIYIAIEWTAIRQQIEKSKKDNEEEKAKVQTFLDSTRESFARMDEYFDVIKKDYQLRITLITGEMERMMGRENYCQKHYPRAFLNFIRTSEIYMLPDHTDVDTLLNAVLRPALFCAQQEHDGWVEIVAKFHDDVNDHLKILRSFKTDHAKYGDVKKITEEIVKEYYKQFNRHINAAIHLDTE